MYFIPLDAVQRRCCMQGQFTIARLQNGFHFYYALYITRSVQFFNYALNGAPGFSHPSFLTPLVFPTPSFLTPPVFPTPSFHTPQFSVFSGAQQSTLSRGHAAPESFGNNRPWFSDDFSGTSGGTSVSKWLRRNGLTACVYIFGRTYILNCKRSYCNLGEMDEGHGGWGFKNWIDAWIFATCLHFQFLPWGLLY